MKGGSRGRKPAAIRRLHGSEDRATHRRGGLAPDAGSIEVPAGLTALEQALWSHYAPVLAALGVLSALDREALRQYVIAAAQVREIRQLQQAPSYRRLVGKRTHALDTQLRAWLQVARTAGQELGLSPASRQRLQPAAPKDERDALEDFITAPIRAVR